MSGSPVHAADLTGVVTDTDGRPLPRAHVRIETASGASTPSRPAATFSDDRGRFTLPDGTDCAIVATLAGFRETRVPCQAGDLRLVLAVAPIEETIVVTATRTDAPSSQVGVSTTTITAEEIERRQQPPVAELLRTAPGVAVIQTGGTGGVTGLFVRGGESSYNKVLVDGIPLNEPGGTFNFNTLSSEHVERVEMVRGANSALFGSDAMSSVIQVFTARGEAGSGARPTTTVQLDGGNYGTMRASASTRGVVNAFDYALGASRFSSDNRVPNSAFDLTTLSANLGGTVGSSTTIRGVVRAQIGTNGTPGQTAYGRPDMDASYQHDDVVGGVTVDQQVTRTFRQRLTYSLGSSWQSSTNLVEDRPYTPTYEGRVAPFAFTDFTFDSRTTLRRHYASYQGDWHVGRATAGDHRITLLADWNGERARLEDRLASTGQRASRDNVGVAAQHQFLWRRLSTTAGIRIERNSSFGTAVVPRASAALLLRRGAGAIGDTRLHGASGLGIKEPTVLQSFSTSPYFRGNPELQPEKSRAIEAGIEQRLAGDRLKADLTWFDNRYRNIIGLRSTGGYTSEYFNIGLTRARGIELSGEASPVAALHLRAGYTLVDSAILESTSPSSPVFAVGQWAFRRPRHSGFVQAAWEWQRLTADLSGTMVGRYVDSDFSSLTPPILANPGRTLWNVRSSYRVTGQLVALLSIDNLTGRDYQEPLGYLALQRVVRAGVRVRF
ncbi:MAG: TonB-dependent receptor [Acidobacteria bacterium]|nr:TonB-dependent receptor [Acidobacteriota bacterium]